MRCKICDYSNSPGAKSLYRGSLIDPKGSRSRYLITDKVTGETVCNVCTFVYEPKGGQPDDR